MSNSISIVVPVYNEVEVLPTSLSTLQEFVKSAPLPMRLIFVDDGSTDGSSELLKAFCARHEQRTLIRFQRNFGLSAALKAGFEASTTAWVAYIDADLQTHPSDFLKLFPFMNDYELVTGIRVERQDSFLKKASSRFANWFRQLFTGDGVCDTGCPLKVIKTSAAKKLLFFDGMHRFIPALIQLQGGRVKQVHVRHFPRRAGRSKFNLWNRSLRPLTDCFVFLWLRRRWIRYELKSS